MKVYDLDDEAEFREFAKGAQRALKVYGTDRYVAYDPQKRIGVTISKLGASQAISVRRMYKEKFQPILKSLIWGGEKIACKEESPPTSATSAKAGSFRRQGQRIRRRQGSPGHRSRN